MKTLKITIGDTTNEFLIDMDADREREIIMEFGHRRVTTTLMGFLQALGLVVVIKERHLIEPEDLHIG
jgi:hypothetical protein